jgi:hypothetical protein
MGKSNIKNEREVIKMGTNMGTKEQRIELLKGMNQYIIDLGDEEIYDLWFLIGVPDEPSDDDYEFIAGDLEEWVKICRLFGELVTKYDT